VVKFEPSLRGSVRRGSSVRPHQAVRGFRKVGATGGRAGGERTLLSPAQARVITAAVYDAVITYELEYTAASHYVNNNLFSCFVLFIYLA
jgi:hypothetical protein